MKPDVKKYLFDIKESIDSIENYLGDKRDFTVYSSNKMLRRAVERELEIIAEAINPPLLSNITFISSYSLYRDIIYDMSKASSLLIIIMFFLLANYIDSAFPDF